MNRYRNTWTAEDVEKLRTVANCDARGLQAAFPDRSLCSIENAFSRFGIKYCTEISWRAWRQSELGALREGVKNINAVALKLNRSYHACLRKAQAMGFIADDDFRAKHTEKLAKEYVTTGREETERELREIETRLLTCSLDESCDLIARRNVLSVRLQSFATDMQKICLEKKK